MQLRVLLGCQQCGNKSPLDHLDVQGRFFCTSCGQERMFDEDLWEEKVLPLASAAGDAYWARAGVFPTFEAPRAADDSDDDDEPLVLVRTVVLPKVGVTQTGLELNSSGMAMTGAGVKTCIMSARMTPGHPICPTCHVALQATTLDRGRIKLHCAQCGLDETHVAPGDALGACPDVVGVVAPEHVEGRQAARVEAQAGTAALAVMCPQCGSPLQPATDGGRLTRCTYCGVASLLPSHVAPRGAAAASTVGAPAFWVAFRAPSWARKKLAEIAAQAQRSAPNPYAPGPSAASAPYKPTYNPTYDRPVRPRKKPGGGAPAIQALSAILVMAGAGGAFFLTRAGHSTSSSSKRTKTSARSTHDTSTSKPKPRAPQAVEVATCHCVFGGDGQTAPQIRVAFAGPASDQTDPWHLNVSSLQGFMTMSNHYTTAPHAGAVWPPDDTTVASPLRMGMACDTGVVALVSGKQASAWSTVTGKLKWTAKLPAEVKLPEAIVPTRMGKSDASCAPLTVKTGNAALTLANGKHVSLHLANGRVR